MSIYENKDLNDICRICMSDLEFRPKYNIQDTAEQKLLDKLQQHDDADEQHPLLLPQFLCNNCFKELSQFCKFANKCQESLENFQQITAQKKVEVLNLLEMPSLDEHSDADVEIFTIADSDDNLAEEISSNDIKLVKREMPIEAAQPAASNLAYSLDANDLELPAQSSKRARVMYTTAAATSTKMSSSSSISKKQTDSPRRKTVNQIARAKTGNNSYSSSRSKEPSGELYACDNCERVFDTQQSLQLHQVMHGVPDEHNKFKCPDCNAHFRSQSAVSLHRKIHTWLPPLKS